MQQRHMADRNPIADMGPLPAVIAVDDRAVLDIGLSPDADNIHVAAQNAAEPDAALGPDDHITDDAGRGCDERRWIDRWEKAAIGQPGGWLNHGLLNQP